MHELSLRGYNDICSYHRCDIPGHRYRAIVASVKTCWSLILSTEEHNEVNIIVKYFKYRSIISFHYFMDFFDLF